jgi:hypothetical protein
MAVAAAGEFTFVVGEVTLTKANGQRSTPVRGTAVDAGDRIATGANGMAQLTMVDQARLSLRPATQFQIEAYPDRRDSNEGAILSLLRGTLRTFTGLIAAGNRDRYVMKTRVATVGIRGSGNILYACEGTDCDESVAPGNQQGAGVTVNHTIEGSHAITNILAEGAPGVPAQQGGPTTLITGPGQTVLVAGSQAPRYIPTPRFIADVASNMTAAKASAATATASGETRDFSPSDAQSLKAVQQTTTSVVGNNLGFVNDIDATGNLTADPLRLRDVVIVNGSPFSGQTTEGQLRSDGNDFRGYTAYAGSGSGIAPGIAGGTPTNGSTVNVDGVGISMGRWDGATLSLFGAGGGGASLGSIHWIVAPSGYPTYLSDVLTGTAVYNLVGSTSPTNQNGTAGTLGAAQINANFSARTLNMNLAVSIPAAGGNTGGSWQLAANGVPFTLNAFFATTGDRLVITNGSGQNSHDNSNLAGSVEGSFVGNGLSGAILGYGIADQTSATSAGYNDVSGVAALSGPRQDGGAPYREGRVSDALGNLADFIRSYAITDRPDEVTVDAQGRVTAFVAPFRPIGTRATYSIGSAQVVESGVDPETGMVWGRWGGGTATISGNGINQQVALNPRYLHYIFAGQQAGPVALPLTGSAAYDVIGSTRPTDGFGNVGTLGSASLNANFTARTVDASVNIAINNQTWTGTASGMPIYRDQYFSAYSGAVSGIPNPAPLVIGCSPNCGSGATGSFDGFFTGRTGQRAGMMYNLGGNSGALAFGRRGG